MSARDKAMIAMANRFMAKRAVSLDPATPFRHGKAVPQFVPFIPYPYQLGAPSGSGAFQYTVSAANAEGPDGISIPASQAAFVDVPVRLDRDADFHLLWIKYEAHLIGATGGSVGSRHTLANPGTALQSGRTPYVASFGQLVPYTRFLDVTAILTTPGARDYYGGLQQDSMSREVKPFPTPLSAVQLSQDGVACIRMDAQIPASGLLTLTFSNRYTSALSVNGCLFGYKVSA